MDCLFERQDVKLNNIKFFRGTDYSISEERFQEELCDSVSRSQAPKVSVSVAPPKCSKHPLDLRTVIAEM